MARQGARRSRVHRGTAVHNRGYHRAHRNRFRAHNTNQDSGESKEPRAMAPGGIEQTEREGLSGYSSLENGAVRMKRAASFFNERPLARWRLAASDKSACTS